MYFSFYVHVCHHFKFIKTSFKGCLFELKVFFLSEVRFFVCFSQVPHSMFPSEVSPLQEWRRELHVTARRLTLPTSAVSASSVSKFQVSTLQVGVLGKYFQQITKKMDFKTTYSFKDFWFSIISLKTEAFYKYLSSGEEFVLCTSDAGKLFLMRYQLIMMQNMLLL